MDMCVIDWTAFWSAVQAIGSILAIVAAIWIGNRQHRQNVELVQDERRRTQEEAERGRQQLRKAVHAMFDVCIRAATSCRDDLYEVKGSIEPFDVHLATELRLTIQLLQDAKEKLANSREIFAIDPQHFYLWQDLVDSLDLLIHQAKEIRTDDASRASYPARMQHHKDFGSDLVVDPPPAVDPLYFDAALDGLRNHLDRVGK